MKSIVIALFGLSAAFSANAQQTDGIPGGINYRTLKCIPSQPFVGTDYGLVIQTQALAPEYNVRGASFTEKGVYPGAVTNYTELPMLYQDKELAYFDFGNNYQVIYNKKDVTAQVVGGGYTYYNCSEQK